MKKSILWDHLSITPSTSRYLLLIKLLTLSMVSVNFLTQSNLVLAADTPTQKKELIPLILRISDQLQRARTALTDSFLCRAQLSDIAIECVNQFYVALASQTQDLHIKDIIFKQIENHELSVNNTKSILLNQTPLRRRLFTSVLKKQQGCIESCSTLSLNSIYESLLAKQLTQNHAFQKKAFSDFEMIFQSWKKQVRAPGQSTSKYDDIFGAWARDKDPNKTLPAARKAEIPEGLHESYLKDNPMLALDLLYYNSKGYDGIGHHENLLYMRDWTYTFKIHPARGTRVDSPRDRTHGYYGIAKEGVGFLKSSPGHLWPHGTDFCNVDPNSSDYTKAVTRLQIPLICGISGSSNLAIFSLLDSGVDFNENQMRRFLISIWSTLCMDGGHSLQEVLSAAKLISDFVQSPEFQSDPFAKNFSKKTMDSLREVTSQINATAAPDNPSPFGDYSSFFSKIDSPEFAVARRRAQGELSRYVDESC